MTQSHSNRDVRIDYTNWRGERRVRLIRPLRQGLGFRSTRWHPEPQWLLTALDLEDHEEKQFALKDIHSWELVK